MTDKLKDKLHEKAEQEVEVRGHKMEKADIFKFVGLIAFFAIMVLIVVMLWPYFHELFEPGGLDRIINDVRGAGPVGFLILLGLQFLQIVVAFIPGEVVQIAAGLLYGPWIGALVILAGCVISSAFIFALVRKLGAPFVQSMVPVQYLEKFRKFEKTGKLNIIVFILFLIPGLPKDVFTYLVPLTDMRMRTFLLLSNVGRIPGIVVSTYAADGLADGRLMESAIIFARWRSSSRVEHRFRERIMKCSRSIRIKTANAIRLSSSTYANLKEILNVVDGIVTKTPWMRRRALAVQDIDAICRMRGGICHGHQRTFE